MRERMENGYKVGDRVCSTFEHKSNGLYVHTVIELNKNSNGYIKLNKKFPWVDIRNIRYATEKEIKMFNLKKVFINEEI